MIEFSDRAIYKLKESNSSIEQSQVVALVPCYSSPENPNFDFIAIGVYERQNRCGDGFLIVMAGDVEISISTPLMSQISGKIVDFRRGKIHLSEDGE